ncbi:Predicted ATPase [Leifsonia sp. 98AMF]|nr:Predicted ATPase [Leifsonia sp. 197AMF]SDJ16688.1 Predicted ATPase [Leifsonia sp. 466MF]SDJ50778.1 Predicted ATPase [Leifsonia sp. 157MF]SDN38161.1 Predicted ATPase [Leifsonia sp. 509MF]SEM83093.1 Predicted ATPase [Leifsonia sp. 467MF]SFM47475.1 Predicted ATPase [Leifsonia sp. 98AMF]
MDAATRNSRSDALAKTIGPQQPRGVYHAAMGLFERGLEAEALRRELAGLYEAGRVVTLTGDAGSGKTALLAAVLGGGDGPSGAGALLGRDGTRVLRGLCDPLGTPRPLGPIRDILAELDGRSRPNLDDPSSVERRFLDRVGEEPTVVVIEDAQWIDAGSVEVLRFVTRRIDRLPLVLILSYRDGEADVGFGHPLLPLLGEIARSDHSAHVALRPLSVDGVRAVLSDDGLDAVRVHEVTGGNPFFVTEIARHPDERMPRTVRDAVLASTSGLAPEDVEVLQLIAAAPDALDDRLLPSLGIDVPTLRRLESSGLLVRTRRGIAFRHELARLAIVDGTAEAVRRLLHQRLLEAFEAVRSTDHAVLTHHAVSAADPERTLRYARLAAAEATRAGAHSEAVAFLSLALERLTADSVDRAELLVVLSDEQYMVGRLAEARESARAALDLLQRLADPDGVAAAHERRAIIEYYSARRREAEEQADLAAHAGGGAAAAASAHATRAYLAYRRQDVDTARTIASAARRLVHSADDAADAARRRIEITEAASDLLEGSVASRTRLLMQAAAAFQVSLDEIGTTAHSNLSAIDIEHRRLAEAEAVLAESIPITITRDIPICNQWQTGMRARLHFIRGRWTASAEDADTVLEGHGAPLALVWPHILSALLAARQGGDRAMIERHLEFAWAYATELGEAPLLLAVLSARAELAWLTGDHDPLLDEAPAYVAAADARPGNAWAIGDLLVWLDRLDVHVSAKQIAEPYRMELEGHHRDAVQAWLQIGAPFDAALAGVHDESPEVAVSALLRLQQLQVDATAARARALLLHRGIRTIPAPPRRTTRSNPAGLTNRQLDVARLIAKGFTNGELAERLYISPKTADHHVSAVLGKLGVSNRREVVRAAAELGLI